MHWSWKVARVRGIDIRIHAAFLLLLLWIGGSTWLGGDLTEALAGVGFVLLVFAIVVLLTHGDLIRGLSEGGPESSVGSVMRASPVALEASTPLKAALEQLERASSPLLPVLDRGELVGIVTLESLGELLTMSSAVEMSRGDRAGRVSSRPAMDRILRVSGSTLATSSRAR